MSPIQDKKECEICAKLKRKFANDEIDEESICQCFAFTCKNCPWLPSRDDEADYVRVIRRRDPDRTRSFNLAYPHRCTRCEREKKRYQRMRRRLERVFECAHSFITRTYRMPKIITFGLPTTWTFEPNPEVARAALKRRLADARRVMQQYGILGGVYVTEVTTRSIEDIGGISYKHHPHVHGMFICPYVKPEHFQEFSLQLRSIGLGHMWIEAPRGKRHKGKYYTAEQQVAGYIAKYMNKDGGTCATFGIMRQKSLT